MTTATVEAPPKESIDTKTVTGRRTVRYESFDDVYADAERLAGIEVRTLGNWSYAQILDHLAKAMGVMIEGTPTMFPMPLRFIMRLTMKRKMLRETLPPGFKYPAEWAPKIGPSQTVTVENALESLRTAIERLKATPHRAPHPGFGKMGPGEWDTFQLRHCEQHMSFVVPASE